jgi:hypothetical protein
MRLADAEHVEVGTVQDHQSFHAASFRRLEWIRHSTLPRITAGAISARASGSAFPQKKDPPVRPGGHLKEGIGMRRPQGSPHAARDQV